MKYLRREQAPISTEAWTLVDEEAARVLRNNLAARRLVDFHGPSDWDISAINLGHVEELSVPPLDGTTASRRRVQPLTEVRAPFELNLHDLHDVDRGSANPDLGPLVDAAMTMSRTEDTIVFNGYSSAGIQGVLEASPHEPLPISEDYDHYPETVARATEVLANAGVDGPYAIALGPRCYTGLLQATNRGGYPLLDNLRNILTGPILRAPVVDGAVVMSVRGGDYEMTVGQDFAVGYTHHDADKVYFYLVETLAFRPLTPEAAVPLRYTA